MITAGAVTHSRHERSDDLDSNCRELRKRYAVCISLTCIKEGKRKGEEGGGVSGERMRERGG